MCDRLGSVCCEITGKRIGVYREKAVANRSDALGSRWHFARQITQTLTDVRLHGRYINKSLDVGMHSRLGAHHPALTIADPHTRTRLVKNAARRSHACRKPRLGLFDNSYRVTVTLQNVRYRLPSGTIVKGAGDQNDS